MFLYQQGQHRAPLPQHHRHASARSGGTRAALTVAIMAAVILLAAGAALAVLTVIGFPR